MLVERYIAVVGKQEVLFCAGGGSGKRERKVEMEGERRERPCLIEAPVSLFRELSFLLRGVMLFPLPLRPNERGHGRPTSGGRGNMEKGGGEGKKKGGSARGWCCCFH